MVSKRNDISTMALPLPSRHREHIGLVDSGRRVNDVVFCDSTRDYIYILLFFPTKRVPTHNNCKSLRSNVILIIGLISTPPPCGSVRTKHYICFILLFFANIFCFPFLRFPSFTAGLVLLAQGFLISAPFPKI